MSAFLKLRQASARDRPARPPPAQKPDAAKRKIAQNEYDQKKRRRTFNKAWQEGRPWLMYDEEKKMMTCSWCNEMTDGRAEGVFKSPKGSFTGARSTNLKKSAVIDHESSEFHKLPAGESLPYPRWVWINKYECEYFNSLSVVSSTI